MFFFYLVKTRGGRAPRLLSPLGPLLGLPTAMVDMDRVGKTVAVTVSAPLMAPPEHPPVRRCTFLPRL